jgi:hypothetical protein
VKVVFVLMVLAVSMGGEGGTYLHPRWVILPIEGNPYPTMALCQAARGGILKRRLTRLAEIQFAKIGCLRKEVWGAGMAPNRKGPQGGH